MEKGVGAAARVFTRVRFFTTATFCDSCPTLFVQQAVSCVSCSFVLFQAGNMKIQTQIHPIVHMKILNEETEKMKLY